MADVSEEFWVQVVALLEQLHGPRITDQLDLEMLKTFSAMIERSWMRMIKDRSEEAYPFPLPEEPEPYRGEY